MFSGSAAQILAELARRRPVTDFLQRNAAADAAASLRAFFYPGQRRFFTGAGRRRATKKTRRAGATTGGCREVIARCIENAGYRVVIVHSTKQEARDRAWLSDTKSGILDILRQFGVLIDDPSIEVFMLGGVRIEARDQVMSLDFGNGSQIRMFGFDDLRAMRKQRGLAKHLYWIDEAQDIRFLDDFYDKAVLAQQDFDCEVWLTGTPGQDCAGMFYDVTKEEESERSPGWEVYTLAQIDNPFFGTVVGGSVDGQLQYFVEDNLKKRTGPFATYLEAEKAATQVRWDRTAGAAKIAKGWTGDEPDFIREFLGKWSKQDARFVYPVHAVNPFDLLYAVQRPAKNPFLSLDPRFAEHPGWFDVDKAISDLPHRRKNNQRRQWMFAIGADFGYNPDPFAIVVWAFAHDSMDVYELFSWKASRVHTDDQGQYLLKIWTQLSNVVVLVGDPAGKQDDFEVWRTRLNLPIDEANKKGKNTLEEFLANDIRLGRVHLRRDSPLHDEMKHLVYLPTKVGKTREAAKHRRASDGIMHGDHCCFVAGTPVHTALGDRPIETVKVGDAVLTREGWKPVVHAFEPSSEPTWRLVTEDGREIVGTADHPVWVENAWVPLASLTPGAMLTSCVQKPSPSTTGVIGVIRNMQIAPCESTSDEASKSEESRLSNTCIAPSGKPCTDPRRKITTSTTETKTPSTTQSRISFACSEQHTFVSTPAHPSEPQCRELTWRLLEKELKPGTALQKDSLGTPLTDEKPWQRVPWSPSRAPAASVAFSPRTETPSSAPTLVVRRLGAKAESTTKIALVPDAALPLDAVVLVAPIVAARTRVLRVEPTGKRELVYNLTVADAHEYYANGILVSNCDAARYSYEALTHYLSKLPVREADPGTAAAMAEEAERIETQMDKREQQTVERLMQGDEDVFDSRGDY